ncbi:hypothetical protein BDD12DRAFT_868816 [Trichophaea hybrida]|nr:hypothetical protein BDD12DRAFT_868816 [Trichophaea hybrida]
MSHEPAQSGNSSTASAPPSIAFTPPRPLHFPTASFVLSASTLSFHPSTHRVLIITDKFHNPPYYFLPCGRKEVNEPIGDCAIRETFVNAGYSVLLLPASHKTLQPSPPYCSGSNHTEAFWILLHPYLARYGNPPTDLTGVVMDLSHYFLGVIEDTTRDKNYGKAFLGQPEEGYDSALIDVKEAVKLLSAGRMEVREEELVWKGDGRDVLWEDVAGSDVGLMEAAMVWRGWGEVAAISPGEAVGKAVEFEEDWNQDREETNSTCGKPTRHYGRSVGRDHQPKRGRGWKPYKGKRLP